MVICLKSLKADVAGTPPHSFPTLPTLMYLSGLSSLPQVTQAWCSHLSCPSLSLTFPSRN